MASLAPDIKDGSQDPGDRLQTEHGAETPVPAKIMIRIRPIGSTKRLSVNTINVPADRQFSSLVNYLQRQLALPAGQPVFCYINSSFSPSPDAQMNDLFNSYAIDDVLNVSYCGTIAFG